MDGSLENLTRDIGREIFSRIRDGQPRRFSRAWLDDLAMSRTMRDEALKVQLFRFVDALPGLRTSRQINRHVREYLEPVGELMPALMRLAVRVSETPPMKWLTPPIARFSARQLARKFIAGSDLSEAMRSIARLRRRKLAFTIDVLGEAILAENEADDYQRTYLDLIAGLAAETAKFPALATVDSPATPRVNVSVKLSALTSRFEPADPEGSSRAVRERLRPILRLAKERGVFINVDMESFAFKDLTLRVFMDTLMEDEFRHWKDVGIAIQAYLTSCADDLTKLLAWVEKRGAPVWVRLVKGAYWDYENVIAAQNGWPVPVFTDKPATDANYEKLIGFLFRHRDRLRPAFGSHNVRSIAHALAVARELGASVDEYEFQMLFGMADPLKEAVSGLGQRVRVYTPFGKLLPGMAYLVRRLLENTSNQGFVRAGFLEHLDEEKLLMDPATLPAKRTVATEVAEFHNEPVADFSQAGPREAMQAALAAQTQAGVPTIPLVIGGESVSTDKTLDSVDPSHRSRVVARVCSASIDQARAAVAAANAAFPLWRKKPTAERCRVLRRAGDLIAERRYELGALIVRECGKSWREADADVAEAADFCRYYAAEMQRMAEPRRRDVPGELNNYFYEPRGVVVVIAPWNFPLAILAGMAAAALVAGNTVIMKPAEQSPAIAAKLMDIFAAAGAPPGSVNFLPGVGEEIGPFLVNHPKVAVIAFTGSRDVGLSIRRDAATVPIGADVVKRVIAEMGGKNAIIVDDDADLDEAVHGVMWSAFGYQGQKCSACSRAIVLSGVHDQFLARLCGATASLTIGPAEDPGNAIGPLIDGEARERVLIRIEEAKAEARLAYAGTVPPNLVNEGFYVAPHIFADVPPTSDLAREEIFGPVLAVIKAKDLDEALAIANSTDYALTGGCYTRSPQTIARVREEFRVGNLYINRKITGALVDRQPFGGFKLSGIGSKAGGPDYLLQFMVPRVITENTLRHGFTPET